MICEYIHCKFHISDYFFFLLGFFSSFLLFSLLKHAFIRDLSDMQPLVELVSEANAEVVYEEKDIEEVVSI